ncbi:hypothetical protein AB4Z32_17045 [Massilia sp. 2TAF26]|uniref:hypothetical protein n=1 Tax=Massilia sp. 2TAF26 TaxID=3233012 RepID=UPI003F98B598
MKSEKRQLIVGSGALILAAITHNWLEASMARHMLVQLPALFIAGWLMFGHTNLIKFFAKIDAHGLTSFVFILSVSSYWMIPRALELSIRSSSYETAKFITIIFAGALTPSALKRANQIVQLFFLGNFCAMAAIFGLLYQDQFKQLCNAYTVDDQALAGVGLVIIACTIPLFWFVFHYRTIIDTTPTEI